MKWENPYLYGAFFEWNPVQALIKTFNVSGNRMLPAFVKIMQSFILMQNN